MKENRIRIEMVPRKEPDLGLYVQALIAVARQRTQDKQQPRNHEPAPIAARTEEASS